MRITKRKLCALVPLLFLMLTSWSYAQNSTIKGKVIDENGEGLLGATVRVDGTGKGMYTDAGGNYEISGLPSGEQIVIITYVGYEERRELVTLKEGQTTEVPLKLNLEGSIVDEVIIVGYGVERKRELTGSISKIGTKEINEIPASSFESALQGKAAGVQVIQGSGIAGAGAMVRIRGVGSITAGGDPLYVVDGIPITQDNFLNGTRGGQNNNPLASINPQDIESIEILKDAAAAAIYGSRGSNGVVLVTTKRGTRGKPQFSLGVRGGVSRPTRLIEFLNTDEWVQMYQEAWENDGNVGQPTLLPGLYTPDSALSNGTTDWYDQVTGLGLKQEYNLSMRQGGKKLNTFASLGFLDNQSYLKGNSYRRYTGRINLDYNILSNLKVGISSSGSYGRNNKVSQAWEGSLGTAQSTALPYFSTEDPNSNFGYPGNPITRRTAIDWRTIERRSINTATIDYSPVKNLIIKVNGSLDYMNMGDNYLEDTTWTNFQSVGKEYTNKVVNWNANGFAQYNFNMLPDNHKLSIMGGSEAQKYTNESGYMEVSDIDQHLYLDWEGSDNSDTIMSTNPTDQYTFSSFFGRVNYLLNNKYTFKASLRVDGSSKFGDDNKYGIFPALGAGYIISEEDFWKDNVSKINFLKLKASYGVTGNADIPSQRRFDLFSSQDNNIFYNGDSILFPTQLGNAGLSWETTTTYDAGFEIGILNDRIHGEFSYYYKDTRDILINVATPPDAGFNSFIDNVGRIENQGIELGITSYNLVGKFKWRTVLNIARNRNKVLDVGTAPPDALAGSGDTRVVVGEPIGVNYLVRFSHVDADNGRPVYLDVDGNETFDWSTDNRVVVGNVQPDFQGGLRNIMEFKNFDLTIFWTFSVGGKLYDDAAKRYNGVVVDWNIRRDMIDRWTGPGDTDAKYPKATLDPATYGLDNYWNYNTTQWLYDASYARLKVVTLGYNIPINVEKNSLINRARVYVTGTNLLTFTPYPGSDPEVVRDHNGPQGRNISPNVTYLTPPQERVFTVGVDLNF